MDRYTGKRFAHENPQLCGAELEIPLAHRGWVPGVTETVGSGAKLGLLRTLSPLSKDDELLPELSEAMIYGAMVRLMRGWSRFLGFTLYSSSHLSGVHLNSTLTIDRILNLYLMSLRTAINQL
ncbi:MAG: hypothetical protein BRC45_16660 [Cyanobacteria bacterium QS_5_48_63]|nr:MAG: hypothetical protein BRC45_16660 [Cyanobacteria bacterium QS_5_48_63]